MTSLEIATRRLKVEFDLLAERQARLIGKLQLMSDANRILAEENRFLRERSFDPEWLAKTLMRERSK